MTIRWGWRRLLVFSKSTTSSFRISHTLLHYIINLWRLTASSLIRINDTWLSSNALYSLTLCTSYSRAPVIRFVIHVRLIGFLRSVSLHPSVAQLHCICATLHYSTPFSASSFLVTTRLQVPLHMIKLVRVSLVLPSYTLRRFFADKSLHIVVLLSHLILTSLVFVLFQLENDSRICIPSVEVRQINLIHSASSLKMRSPSLLASEINTSMNMSILDECSTSNLHFTNMIVVFRHQDQMIDKCSKYLYYWNSVYLQYLNITKRYSVIFWDISVIFFQYDD